MTNLVRATVLSLLASFAITGAAAAQARLPGAGVPIPRAVRGASAVVIAELTRLGEPSPEAPGQTLFAGCEARLVTVLGGRPPTPLVFDVFVQRLVGAQSEGDPEVGHAYIFILGRRGGGAVRALRVLEVDASNRAAVARALTSGGATAGARRRAGT